MEHWAYITGIQADGSRVQFERWVYDNWLHDNLRDPLLLQLLRSCHHFY